MCKYINMKSLRCWIIKNFRWFRACLQSFLSCGLRTRFTVNSPRSANHVRERRTKKRKINFHSVPERFNYVYKCERIRIVPFVVMDGNCFFNVDWRLCQLWKCDAFIKENNVIFQWNCFKDDLTTLFPYDKMFGKSL